MYIIIQVVVWLPGTDEEFDEGLSRQRVEAGDRLVIVSRATTHLVVVEEAEKKDVEEAQVEVEVEDVVEEEEVEKKGVEVEEEMEMEEVVGVMASRERGQCDRRKER